MLLIARALVLALSTFGALPAQSADPFAYDRRAPLALSSTLTRSDGDVDVFAIAFESPKGGRVTGKLFVPKSNPGTRLAGILMAHGAPGSTANLDPRAFYFARKGAVVIGIDAAFARRDAKDPIAFTPRDATEQVQTITDMRRAIDVLVARPDVDPARLGYIGNSYGAAMGGILAGVEDRVRAFVLAVGDAGFVAHFTAADGGWLPPVSDLPGPQRDAWLAAMRPISGEAFFPRAKGDRIFLQSGSSDDAVLPHVARAFHALAPAGAEKRWYDAGHRLPPAHFADQIEFLHRKIGLAAPVDADRAGPYPPSASAR
jgi:hypothetical protein